MELLKDPLTRKALPMSHANAALTPRARLRLARLIVEDHWPVTVAAEMFLVSPVTASAWSVVARV